MTRGELRSTVLARLNRDDCTAGMADGFIAEAVRRVEREVRAPFMEKTYTVDTTGGVSTFVAPPDYLEDFDMLVDGRPLVKQVYRVLLRASPACTPFAYARYGTAFHIRGMVAEGQTLELFYYGRFDQTVLDTDTNTLLTHEPDLALYAALSAAGDHFQHEKTPEWDNRYVSVRENVLAAAVDEAMRGGPMAIQPLYSDPD